MFIENRISLEGGHSHKACSVISIKQGVVKNKYRDISTSPHFFERSK